MSSRKAAVEAALAKQRWPPEGEAAARRAPPADLGAEELFDEVICRDRAFGPLLAQIKSAYDGFLRDRGVAVPAAPVAALQEEVAPRRRILDGTPQADLALSELAVEAARRALLDPEDLTPREPPSEFAKAYELQRENAALRRLLERMRHDAANGRERTEEAGGLTPRSSCDGDWGAGPPGTREPLGSTKKPSFVPGLDFAALTPYEDEEDEDGAEDEYGAEYQTEYSTESAGYASPGSHEAWAHYPY